MGSSKKQTVGYWYKLLLQYGLARGPVDAFLEFRGGDRTAWKGELTSSGTININAPNLWGGEKSEGGIVGQADVMFGEQDQAPNAYLAANLSEKQSGLRGKLVFAFKGGRFGINPYPKSVGFKFRRVYKGWDDNEPWYPEKALIPIGIEEVDGGSLPELGDTSGGWRYLQVLNTDPADYSAPDFDDSAWAIGQMPFASLNDHIYTEPSGFPANYNTFWQVNRTMWMRKTVSLPAAAQVNMQILIDNYATIWVNGHMVLGPESGWDGEPDLSKNFFEFSIPGAFLVPGDNVFVIKAKDTGLWTYCATRATAVLTYRTGAMNPIHIIFDSLTQQDMMGEPLANLDLDSFTAAADRCYDERFGLCTEYDHQRETGEQFQQRIQNVVGAAVTQSRIDGRYRVDLIRGDYDLESLPILLDRHILEFEREPSNPNDSVNEVVVEWFDPDKKEKRATTPLQSLGAIQSAGAVISETSKYPEIPDEGLALRVAARDLRNKSSLTNRFKMTTTRETYGWRSGQFFRLQAPRRGIADMVCMVGEISDGSLRSASMTLTAVQDVSGMPDSVYVDIEPGVDTEPNQEPANAIAQRAIEAPYVEIAGTLPTTELAALPEDAGYLIAMGVRAPTGKNFNLWTKADAEDYVDQGVGDWCPSALVVEAAGFDPADDTFTLSSPRDLDRVAVGTAALWGDELVRVDAIDADALTCTLGRGCGDAVILKHAAGERVWFYAQWGASDQRQYVAAEVVSAKLLTNTASQQLDIALANVSTVTMDQRAQRPYPPAGLRVNGEIEPGVLIGEVVLTWTHRDRLLQDDQLVDDGVASIGPEPGTTYTARWYMNGVLVETQAAIVGTTTSYEPAGGGLLRIELESVRDGLASWTMHVREIAVGSPLLTEGGDLITTEDDEAILME